MRFSAASAIAFCLAALPATAQTANLFLGSWACQHSMEPYSGNAYDKHFWEYQMNVAPDGSWQMSGMYYNPVTGQTAMQGGGSWQPQSGAPSADFQGEYWLANGSVAPYTVVYTAADQRNLYLQFRGHSHIQNATCQR
ncbi:hypothetical protein P1J78_02070 [Psychromarinibacter sp. C21-152]|uniref:Lipocalin-like domain-containing protein n=1 Tax=Psychromarinibacter sediminicola TaxID=3033385 RepID=A0AAE3NPC2_9RHOB|nr:hypothetical protein [Psychromarinibacter sediminicola]MDF0599506.1 hypothetical protein [Psychromarinibacter sediminicola]